MAADRSWHWIASVADPRERNPVIMRMSTSLAFMPETLVLEGPDLCFFRASDVSVSGFVLVGGARGSDTLDQTRRALDRMDDASDALSLVEFCKYPFMLLDHGLDRLPDRFLPGREIYLDARFGRRPPLISEEGDRVKVWYKRLSNARGSRGESSAVERAIRLSIDSLCTSNQFTGVMLYSAFEEICDALGGPSAARDRLAFSKQDRARIERARRPIAHGGRKAKNQPDVPMSVLQAVARKSFLNVLSTFLESLEPDQSPEPT